MEQTSSGYMTNPPSLKKWRTSMGNLTILYENN